MKKLILLTALLICSFTQAQDIAYLSGLNKLSSESNCMEVAKGMAFLQPKKLRFLRAKDFPKLGYYAIRFVPEDMTDQEYDSLELGDQDKFFTVRFYYWMEGENKNLEIKGIKTYRLSQVSGSYLSLFPIWKKYINTEADIVKTQESSTRTYKDIDNKLHYLLMDKGEIWVLMNRS